MVNVFQVVDKSTRTWTGDIKQYKHVDINTSPEMFGIAFHPPGEERL